MRYDIVVAGKLRRVSVERYGPQFLVEVDGRSWVVDAVRSFRHTLSLLIARFDVSSTALSSPEPSASPARSFEVTVARSEQSEAIVTVQSTSRRVTVIEG